MTGSRRSRVVLALAAIVVLLAAAVLVALPEVVRHVAVAQLEELTRRDVTLDDVDLNLFTGRVALKGFRLAQRDSRDTAVGFERLDVGISLTSLVLKHARITDLRLTAPQISATRTGPGAYDFSDLLALVPPADPNAPKSAWTVTIDRVALERGSVVARDRAVTPASEWRIDHLTLDGGALTTRPHGRSGRVEVRAAINGARLAVNATQIALAPAAATIALTVDDLALPLATPYVPAHVLAVPRAGVARAALKLSVTPKDGVLLMTASGDLGVERLELVRRDGDAAFFTLGRLGVTIARADLGAREVVVGNVAIDGLALEAARGRDGAIDLAALVAPAPAAPAPVATPAPVVTAQPFTVTIDRLALTNSAVRVRDGAVMPAAEWKLANLTATAEKVTTAAGRDAGRYTIAADVNGAKLAITDGTLKLQPLAVGGRVALSGVELAWARPYLSTDIPVAPPVGRFGATLAFDVTPTPTLAGTISGDIALDAVGVTHKSGAPLATLARARFKVAGMDLATRNIRVSTVELDGLDARALRARDGAIDLVAAFTTPGSTPPAPARTAPASGSLTLQIDQVTMRRTALTLTDQAVTPTAVLPVTDWTIALRDFTWPNRRASQIETALTLPGGGRFTLKGTARLTPFEAVVETSLRNGTPEPFAAYVPFKAQLEGRFHGDNRAEVRMTPIGITVRSTGRSWGDGLVVRDPDAPAGATPPLRIERIALDGIDFSWPTSGRVARVTITKPDARITRDKDGAIDIVSLFAFQPVAPAADKPALPAPPSTPPAPPTQPRETSATPPGAPFALEVDAFVLEDGFTRFTDRSTEPAFTETVSRFRVALDGLSNAPGRRATLAMNATVGGKATIETRGQIAPLGEIYADLVTELRDYALPSVNPYVNGAIAWVIDEGTLSATLRTRVEKGVLDARNEFDVRRLHVTKAPGHDTAQQKLGLPLGMIVALITDRDNGFKTSIPITGRIDDRQLVWSDAIWTAVRNVLVNVAAAPFRAIGKLFTSSDNRIDKLEVEPVTFPLGSATLAPETERHLLRVADFLRRAPKISLELAPVVTRADTDRLRADTLRVRVEKRQKDSALPSWAAAVAAEYARRFPGTPPPKTSDEQMVRLTEAEPVPEDVVAALRAKRLQAVLEALTGAEGITASRLRPRDTAPIADEAAPGRIEFQIAQ